jgi:hypothetical protein
VVSRRERGSLFTYDSVARSLLGDSTSVLKFGGPNALELISEWFQSITRSQMPRVAGREAGWLQMDVHVPTLLMTEHVMVRNVWFPAKDVRKDLSASPLCNGCDGRLDVIRDQMVHIASLWKHRQDHCDRISSPTLQCETLVNECLSP